MPVIPRTSFTPSLAISLLLGASLSGLLSPVALGISAGGLVATKSGNDLILMFPTISPNLYTVQTSADLLQHWTDLQPVIQGDGTMKTVAVTNVISAGKGFYRLLIQTPAKLLLPQSSAFAILGHSCGGIKEQAYVTGFDPTSGYPWAMFSFPPLSAPAVVGSPPAR